MSEHSRSPQPLFVQGLKNLTIFNPWSIVNSKIYEFLDILGDLHIRVKMWMDTLTHPSVRIFMLGTLRPSERAVHFVSVLLLHVQGQTQTSPSSLSLSVSEVSTKEVGDGLPGEG